MEPANGSAATRAGNDMIIIKGLHTLTKLLKVNRTFLRAAPTDSPASRFQRGDGIVGCGAETGANVGSSSHRDVVNDGRDDGRLGERDLGGAACESQRPLRVLVSAYACGPHEGSEPGVGWALLRAAAVRHRVTVLTVPRYAGPIMEALAEEGITTVRVVPIATPAWLSRFRGKQGLGHADYFFWQWRTWRVTSHLAADFDVAHHVTYSSDWTPVALHFVPGLPVVWGPVGGTAPFLWRLLPFMSFRGLVFEAVRTFLTNSSRILTAAAVRRSGCVVVGASREVAARFSGLGVPTFVEPACALPPAPADSEGARPARTPDGVRRAVFVGRLRSWKGPYLALHAMTYLPGNWQLDLYGTGPEAAGLRRRATRLGLGDRVRLLGQQPREEVFSALLNADVFLLPTLHDTAAYSVAEAVRVGCPVVCLDVPGPPGLIEGTTGIAVPASADAPRRLAEAMTRVTPHPPSDRWNADRFTGLVDEWYCAAMSQFSGSAGSA